MKKTRMITDSLMLVLLPLLMAYSLIGEDKHEMIGICMFAVFIIHHAINRRWWMGIFREKYSPARLMNTVVNILMSVYMILQPISGILMSKYVLKTEDTGKTAGEELAEDKTIDEAETAQGPAEPEEEEHNSVLVIYFSHTGTTKGVSEYLHGMVGDDLIEIEPVDPYPAGYSDALDPAKKEQRENARPKIADKIGHFDSYETIYLGYPIWWGTTPMIINTLLESYDFSGKTVVPYATSGGTGIEKSIQDIRNEIPDADVKDGLLVRDNDDIIPWLRELGLYK